MLLFSQVRVIFVLYKTFCYLMYIVFDQGFESSLRLSVCPVLAAEPTIMLDLEFNPLKLHKHTTILINTHNPTFEIIMRKVTPFYDF